jgi:DNA-binding transcriptional MocR family regulator
MSNDAAIGMTNTARRLRCEGLVRLLGSWAVSGGPLYRDLAAGLRRLVETGELLPRTALPPERELARALSVSRSTVVTAYDLLKADGLLEGRQGSGTFVLPPQESGLPPLGGYATRAGDNPLFRSILVSPTGIVDFSLAGLFGHGGLLEVVREIDDDELADASERHGYVPLGIAPLRRAISEMLSGDGVPTEPEQLLVTAGAQQALTLLTALYLRPGDSAIVEEPTYPGAIEAFRTAGAQLEAAESDEYGVRPDAVERLLGRTAARLVYLTPTYANPTGSVMPEARRAEIARIAARFRVPVIEDTVLAHLALSEAAPPRHISAHDPQGMVVLVGSVSKLAWGGLRCGWIRAPESAIGRLARLKAINDLGSPILSQLVVARLLPRRSALVQQRRAELLPRLERLACLLRELLPAWQWRHPPGGLSLWVRMPHGDAGEFAQVALRCGVAVVPGPVFSPVEGCRQHLRIPFGLPEEALAEGVRRLAAAWAAYAPGATQYPSATGAVV